MSRCKACNKVMDERELIINPKTQQMEDLCFKCKGASMQAAEDEDVRYVADLLSEHKYDTDNQEDFTC